MRQPLNLTPYRRNETYPGGYLVPTEMTDGSVLDVICTPKEAKAKAQRKHLTDSEMSAIYWCWKATASSHREPRSRARTIERFAQTPSFEEAA